MTIGISLSLFVGPFVSADDQIGQAPTQKKDTRPIIVFDGNCGPALIGLKSLTSRLEAKKNPLYDHSFSPLLTDFDKLNILRLEQTIAFRKGDKEDFISSSADLKTQLWRTENSDVIFLEAFRHVDERNPRAAEIIRIIQTYVPLLYGQKHHANIVFLLNKRSKHSVDMARRSLKTLRLVSKGTAKGGSRSIVFGYHYAELILDVLEYQVSHQPDEMLSSLSALEDYVAKRVKGWDELTRTGTSICRMQAGIILDTVTWLWLAADVKALDGDANALKRWRAMLDQMLTKTKDRDPILTAFLNGLEAKVSGVTHDKNEGLKWLQNAGEAELAGRITDLGTYKAPPQTGVSISY